MYVYIHTHTHTYRDNSFRDVRSWLGSSQGSFKQDTEAGDRAQRAKQLSNAVDEHVQKLGSGNVRNTLSFRQVPGKTSEISSNWHNFSIVLYTPFFVLIWLTSPLYSIL